MYRRAQLFCHAHAMPMPTWTPDTTMPDPCCTHASPCLIVTHNVTQCDTHARPMLSPCATHAGPMPDPCTPMPGPCATHARPMPCPSSRIYPARYIITREFELRDAPQRKKDSRSRISRLVGRLLPFSERLAELEFHSVLGSNTVDFLQPPNLNHFS